MKTRTIVPLVLALALAGVAVKMGRNVLLSKTAAPTADEKQVVIAAADLAAGELLDEKKIRLENIATKNLPANIYTSLEPLKGRRVVSALSKNQVLTELNLADEAASSSLQAVIPPGKRAVTVEVDDQAGLAGLISPGARVDMVATMIIDDQTRAVTVVENVLVSAIDRNLSADKKDEASGNDRNSKRSITLLVTPAQAQAIDLAYAKSKPRLVLRSGDDTESVKNDGVTLADLTRATPQQPQSAQPGGLDASRIQAMIADAMKGRAGTAAATPAPAAQPNSTHQIRVFRGGVESTEQFDAPGESATPEAKASPERPAAQALSTTEDGVVAR